MKGGKNFFAEGDVAYTCYFISCLRDPHDFFTKVTGRTIKYTPEKTFDIVNVSSVDESQARRAFFDSVKKILQGTKDPKSGENWFERYAGLDLREEHGDFTKKEIIFPTELGRGGIRLMSFNSTATAPEGVHILRFYADELSRANTKAKHREATALLELGLNNTTASFPNNIGKVLEWSYPNDTDYDLTYERYEASFKQSQIYGRRYSTYEFNPTVKREHFQKRYEADHQKAQRVFECIKHISKQNFFQPYVDKIPEMENPLITGKLAYHRKVIERQTNKGMRAFTTVEVLRIQGDNRRRCFACDPSKVRDRFVILGGYIEPIDTLKMDMFIGDSYEVVSTNVKPVIDIAIVIDPTQSAPIDYIGIGDIFSILIKAFPNTQSINSDHFQNEKLLQEVIQKGVSAETYFFSNQKQIQLYTMLKGNIWNNNIDFYHDHHALDFANRKMNITQAVIWELQGLIQDGSKIDHPIWGSKDIADALAILNWDLMHLETKGGTNDIDLLNNEKLYAYTSLYLREKARLKKEKVPLKELNQKLKEILKLTDLQFQRIAEYAFERYGEPY